MRICREFENLRDLRALSGNFCDKNLLSGKFSLFVALVICPLCLWQCLNYFLVLVLLTSPPYDFVCDYIFLPQYKKKPSSFMFNWCVLSSLAAPAVSHRSINIEGWYWNKQDHRRWRYYSWLLDYQSPYFPIDYGIAGDHQIAGDHRIAGVHRIAGIIKFLWIINPI